MKKIIGIFVCMLFIATAIPIVEAQSVEITVSSSSYETRRATIFGRWKI